MPRVTHLAPVLALTFLGLGGCTSLALQGLNGTKSCPMGLVAAADTTMYILEHLQPGDPVSKLLPLTPAKVTRSTLPGGIAVQTLYYKTGDSRCRGMPTDEAYTPVVTAQNGQILGVGYLALQHYSGLTGTN